MDSRTEDRIIEALLRIETSLAEVRERMSAADVHRENIRDTVDANTAKIAKLDERTRTLEEHRARATVIFGVASVVGGAFVTALSRFILGG